MAGKKTLLFLSCGTNAVAHVSSVLRAKYPDDFRLFGADCNDPWLIANADRFDRFYKVPPAADNGYVGAIENILRQEKIDYIVPSFDFDQQRFHAGSEMLLRYGVMSLAAPASTLSAYQDKLTMNRALLAAGLAIPRQYEESEVAENDVYVVKPINGVGSVGVRRMTGADIRLSGLGHGCLIQECCVGPEVTVECFYWQGMLSTVCRERIQSKAGVCTKARVFKSVRLERICQKFVRAFAVPLFFNLQFMRNSNGEDVITDVNLRFAGGMALSYAAGWDEVSAFAKVLLGKSAVEVFESVPEFLPETYVVRQYAEKVTKNRDRVVAFDLDGTLLDSRVRHGVVMADVLAQRGLGIAVDDLIQFKRKGGNNVDWLRSKGVGAETAEGIQASWIALIEDDRYLSGDALYDDAHALLSSYSEWRCVLVTARQNHAGLYRQLERLGLREYFAEVYVVNPGARVSREKAEILRQCGALLFFGDTESDATAASLADCKFIWRDNGFGDL